MSSAKASPKKKPTLLSKRMEKRRSKLFEDCNRFGLDFHAELKKLKSGGGYINERDKREFLENELSIQDSHLSPEEKQKKLTNNDIMDAVRQCRAKYAMGWCYAGDLPLAYYTEYLLQYLLDDKQNIHLRNALDSGDPPRDMDWTHVGGGVASSLERLGCKKLESFYTNDQLLWEWIDVLMIGQKYPSRADILSKEAPNLNPSTVRRGSLRNEIVMGRMTDFILAIDVFLEYSAIQRSANNEFRSTRKMPALQNIMEEVWIQVDLDGDGTLSVEEAEEVTRTVLSRPMFGKVLIAMVCNDPNSAKAAAVRDAIPSQVIQAATGVCSIAKEFWSLMDIDGDGEVSDQEFCEKFSVAFETAIALPIADKLAFVAFDKPVPQEIRIEENLRHNAIQGRSGRTCTMSECEYIEYHDSCGRRQTYKDPVNANQVPVDDVKRSFPEAPAAANANDGPSCCVAKVARFDEEVEEWDTSLLAAAPICQKEHCQEVSKEGCKKGCSIM